MAATGRLPLPALRTFKESRSADTQPDSHADGIHVSGVPDEPQLLRPAGQHQPGLESAARRLLLQFPEGDTTERTVPIGQQIHQRLHQPLRIHGPAQCGLQSLCTAAEH